MVSATAAPAPSRRACAAENQARRGASVKDRRNVNPSRPQFPSVHAGLEIGPTGLRAVVLEPRRLCGEVCEACAAGRTTECADGARAHDPRTQAMRLLLLRLQPRLESRVVEDRHPRVVGVQVVVTEAPAPLVGRVQRAHRRVAIAKCREEPGMVVHTAGLLRRAATISVNGSLMTSICSSRRLNSRSNSC